MKNLSIVEKIGILLLIIGFISKILLRIYPDNLIASYGNELFVFGASIWAVGLFLRLYKKNKH